MSRPVLRTRPDPAVASSSRSGIEQFNPYISELRNQMLKVLVVFIIGGIVGAIYYQKIVSFMMGLFQLEGINLVLTSPYQFIELSMRTGLITGILAALPIFIFYLLKYIRPALTKKEFHTLLKLLPISIVLFAAGFAFGVWVVQYVINLFSQTSSSFEIGNIWDLSQFLSQILVTGISLAFVFQLPIVLTGLLQLGIVKVKDIKAKRKLVYVGLLIFAALLPTTDVVALTLLTLIPLFLFEITLVLNHKAGKKRKA